MEHIVSFWSIYFVFFAQTSTNVIPWQKLARVCGKNINVFAKIYIQNIIILLLFFRIYCSPELV